MTVISFFLCLINIALKRMEQATQSAEAYQKQFEYGLYGINKKRFFKNNQHHAQ